MSNTGRPASAATPLVIDVDTFDFEHLIHAVCLLGVDEVHLEATPEILPHLAAAAFAYPGPLPTGFQLCEPGCLDHAPHDHAPHENPTRITATELLAAREQPRTRARV